MGLSAIIPVLHGISLFGYAQLSRTMSLPLVVTQGVLYIFGAGLYATRLPERLRPGQYDIWGSSHQIFHICVLLACGVHLYGLVRAFDWRHGIGGIGSFASNVPLGRISDN
jgi:adiponectin receptor